MSLNINNNETGMLAHQLASLAGESLADAVTTAIRERIKRLQEKDTLTGDLMNIADKTSVLLNKTPDSTRFFDTLYDENGLPK
ncbi:MAG: type II toxin-antitoxin system VapB family antitoxin [Chryseobacterium sp.]